MRTREVTCDGKVKLTQDVARAILKRKSDDKRVAYRCPFCGGWHLGNKSGTVKQRRAP